MHSQTEFVNEKRRASGNAFRNEVWERENILLGKNYAGYTLRSALVVDEKPEHRMIVINVRNWLGFQAVEANNAQEGIDKAKEVQPLFILMELVMQAMTGFEAVKVNY
jgi:PleD family two-component response regulator